MYRVNHFDVEHRIKQVTTSENIFADSESVRVAEVTEGICGTIGSDFPEVNSLCFTLDDETIEDNSYSKIFYPLITNILYDGQAGAHSGDGDFYVCEYASSTLYGLLAAGWSDAEASGAITYSTNKIIHPVKGKILNTLVLEED